MGPVLFILYTKPLSDLIQCHSTESQSFANNTQLQVSVPSSTFSLQYLLWIPVCQTSRPGCWKTNLNLTMIKHRPSSCAYLPGLFQSANHLCGCEISFSSSPRNLGFYIRDDISVELHTKNTCQSAYSELRRSSTIRYLLSFYSSKPCVSTFVFFWLDYCNSLLSGCPKHLFEKRQKIKNSAARLLPKAHK